MERLKARIHITQDRLMQEYIRIGLYDIRKLFNEDGSIKQPHELDEDTLAATSFYHCMKAINTVV